MADEYAINEGVSELPIVLFSPTEGTTHFFYSVRTQRIASSGFIVVTIDAPYDVDIVEYLDSSVPFVNATIVANPTTADVELAISGGVQDASFVFD